MKHTEETKKRISESLTGRIQSIETTNKRSITAKKNGVGKWNKGKKCSQETKFRMSIAQKKIGNKPPILWGNKNNLGKKRSKKTKRKMSLARIGKPTKKRGQHNPNCISTYERKLWLNNKRRIIKIGNGGSHTLGEWEHLKALYNWTCPSCWKKEPEIKLSKDHIIPLSKGGSDNLENLQPLCRSCNSKKKDKTKKYEI